MQSYTAGSSMQNYMHRFLDLTVSMQGTESLAVSTSINVLTEEKRKLENELDKAKTEMQSYNQSLYNLTQQLDDNQQVIKDLHGEIVDLKGTVEGLKASLNLARSETRAIMAENSTLKIKLFNIKAQEKRDAAGHLSDISDEEGATNHLDDDDDIKITGVEKPTDDSGCTNTGQNNTIKRTGKGGPFKRTRHS